MINTNLKLVRSQVDQMMVNLDKGSRAARDEMMVAMIQLAKEEIKGKRPYTLSASGKTKYYEKATAGQPPMNRSGNLRRFIIGEKTNNGFASYSAIVGPTMEYSRAVEKGGSYAPESWHGTTAMQGFPYMHPAYLKFREIYPAILKKHIGEGI